MEKDLLAYKILSIMLIINMCCCNITSSILGIFAFILIIKQSKLEEDIYISRIKIMITIGYIIFIINIIISFIISFGDTLLNLFI